jgi:hypothetical protein
MPRQNWLDAAQETTLIDEYAQKLTPFLDALADGRIDTKELTAQEKRVVELMKKIEPTLNDAQHAEVTKLLCELTALNVMQTLNSIQAERKPTKFRG